MVKTALAANAPKWRTLDGREILISKLTKTHLNNIIVHLRGRQKYVARPDVQHILLALLKRAKKLGIIPNSIYYNTTQVFVYGVPTLSQLPWSGYKFKNVAKCRVCNDIIVSKTQHDFVRCKCGSIAIDGGNEYCRRIGDSANFTPFAFDYMNETWYDGY